jgi:hypothetical protein
MVSEIWSHCGLDKYSINLNPRCLGHNSFFIVHNLSRLGCDWFSNANPCPHGNQNHSWTILGPSCLLDKVKCLMIKIWLPFELNQNSIIKCCNLSRWRPYFYPLATKFRFLDLGPYLNGDLFLSLDLGPYPNGDFFWSLNFGPYLNCDLF